MYTILNFKNTNNYQISYKYLKYNFGKKLHLASISTSKPNNQKQILKVFVIQKLLQWWRFVPIGYLYLESLKEYNNILSDVLVEVLESRG